MTFNLNTQSTKRDKDAMNEDSSSDEDEDPDNMGVPGKFSNKIRDLLVCFDWNSEDKRDSVN